MFFFVSSRRRHTICALVTGVQTCALPIFADFHSRYDLFLTPSLAMPPARVGEIRTPDWQQRALRVLLALGLEGLLLKTDLIEQMVQENLKWVPFTQLANLRSEEHRVGKECVSTC